MSRTHPLIGKKIVDKKQFNDEVEKSLIIETLGKVVFSKKYDAILHIGDVTTWYITYDEKNENTIISVTKTR
jgi:hypothetical protein